MKKYQTIVHLVIKESNLAESYKMACATNPKLAPSKIITVSVVAAILKKGRSKSPHDVEMLVFCNRSCLLSGA